MGCCCQQNWLICLSIIKYSDKPITSVQELNKGGVPSKIVIASLKMWKKIIESQLLGISVQQWYKWGWRRPEDVAWVSGTSRPDFFHTLTQCIFTNTKSKFEVNEIRWTVKWQESSESPLRFQGWWIRHLVFSENGEKLWGPAPRTIVEDQQRQIYFSDQYDSGAHPVSDN